MKSTLCTCVGRQGVFYSDFYRWRVLLVLGRQKNTSIYSSPFATYLCDMPRLPLDARFRVIGMLSGGATQDDAANRFGVHRHTVRSVAKTRDKRTTGRVLDGQVWRHRGKMCTSGSCICTVATKLPKPLPGPSPDCFVSVEEMCGTAYVHTAYTLADPVFAHYWPTLSPHLALIEDVSVMKWTAVCDSAVTHFSRFEYW